VKPALKVAIAGLGTVGAGTLQLLARQAELLAVRAGRRIIVAAVSARDRRRDRGVDLSAVRWYEDAVAMTKKYFDDWNGNGKTAAFPEPQPSTPARATPEK
jgi:homoserine dehydrogenase